MFRFYNANPENKITSDCVIRAISLALNMEYSDTVELLIEHSNFFNCDMLVKDCYGSLLDNYFLLSKYKGWNQKVGEIVDNLSDCILILRIEGHLTCAIYGVIYDIWDTSNEPVDVFWIVDTE